MPKHNVHKLNMHFVTSSVVIIKVANRTSSEFELSTTSLSSNVRLENHRREGDGPGHNE
jgi:hypothetical protein